MLRFIKTTLNPDAYHGRGKKPPFFEGWYFKLVNASGERSLAVIPGVFSATPPDQSIAFVQLFDGNSGAVSISTFRLSEFQETYRSFDIRIASNRFSTHSLRLDIQTDEGHTEGELRFIDPHPWPVTATSPGIMGWYAWAPFMQCYHGVVSLDHAIEGTLRVNGETIDFDGGRGYIEKDWGRSFPSSWIWLQSNHFDSPGTSLTLSVAVIPWIRGEFPGFIIGFLHKGHLYRFASYTGASIEQLDLTEDRIHLRIRDRSHLLDVVAQSSGTSGMLYAPTSSGMNRRIAESMNARIVVKLFSYRSKQSLIFSGTGRNAGMETTGDLAKLVGLWIKTKNKPDNDLDA